MATPVEELREPMIICLPESQGVRKAWFLQERETGQTVDLFLNPDSSLFLKICLCILKKGEVSNIILFIFNFFMLTVLLRVCYISEGK